MKKFLILPFIVLTGCSTTLPPQNYGITETYKECNGNSCRIVSRSDREVTVRQLPIPKTMGQIIEVKVEEESDNPYDDATNPYDLPPEPVQTAEEKKESQERLMKAIKDAVKRDSCKCQQGDPLCDCL